MDHNNFHAKSIKRNFNRKFIKLLVRNVTLYIIIRLWLIGADNMKDYMSVGELAKHMNVSVRTLQYYDETGILKPSSMSTGGRRLYENKDMIRLQQIISFKYLGFSLEEIRDHILPLNSPQEVAEALQQQSSILDAQIQQLQKAKQAIDALQNEVQCIQEVNFKKYAQIIELLRMGNKDFWVMKLFNETLSDHVQDRFYDKIELAENIFQTYQEVLEEAVTLTQLNEPYDSEKSQALVKRWWQMILDFTGGDLSLIPELMKFNDQKDLWDQTMADKQKVVDLFLGNALDLYLKNEQIELSKEDA